MKLLSTTKQKLTRMKQTKLFLLTLLMILVGSLAGCTSNRNMTGKQYIKKEQKYRNSEAATKRYEKANKRGFFKKLFER